MAVQVNPPPTLRIPRSFISDPEVRAFIEQQNTIIFQLWNRTGGDTDEVGEGTAGVEANALAISELSNGPSILSQLQLIQRQIDGPPEFTVDTAGFTTDTTFITTDKVIA